MLVGSRIGLTMSLTLIFMSTSSGEDQLSRQRRYVPPQIDACSFYNALVKFIGEYKDITLDEMSSQVIKLELAMERYKTQPGVSDFVKSFGGLAKSLQGVVNGLNSMRRNRPDLVEDIRAIDFDKKVKNAGKALMAKSLPFYTYTQDVLTWQQAIGFKIRKTKGAAKKLVKLVKKSLKKTKDRSNKDALSSLSKTASVFYKNTNDAAKAFTKTSKAFIATKKVIDNQRKKRAINPMPGIPRVCALRPAPEAGCPNCGDGGRCRKLPFTAYCECAPMWRGKLCDEKVYKAALPCCRAHGDTHIDTFDGQTINVQTPWQLIMSTPTSGGMGFLYKLDQYFKNPWDTVTWIESVYLKLYGPGPANTRTEHEFEIFHSDALGFHVKINGVRVIPPYTFSQFYNDLTGPFGNPILVDHIITIVDGYATIDVLTIFGVKLQFNGHANPGQARFYVDTLYWSVQGMCGDADGKALNDIKKREDPDYKPIIGPNPGRTMGTSWLVHPSRPVTLPDLPHMTVWNPPQTRKRRGTTKIDQKRLETAKLLCKHADCQLTERTPRFDGCVADVYFSANDKEICNVLEAEIFTHSKCKHSEFDCAAIKNEAERRG